MSVHTCLILSNCILVINNIVNVNYTSVLKKKGNNFEHNRRKTNTLRNKNWILKAEKAEEN